MGVNLIALAIPIFVVSMAIELWVARARGRAVYRFADAVSDLSCGMFQQVGGLFFAAALLGVYAWVWEHHRLFTPSTGAAWAIALVGVDFLYYWWHRLSHEVNFLWAAHVVHHSSEDYNLAVALRQALATDFTALPFYLPLALAGVPPLVYVAAHSLSTLYQFWIHTELVGKLGPVEAVINTPSHHRVHHAINPQYLDKNYGATLIVWDRLFGTFAVEEEQPVFGITKPLASFHVLWAQAHYFCEMARDAWRAPHFADKLRIWFASPAWHARGLEVAPGRDWTKKFDVPVGAAKRAVVGVVMVAAIVGTFALLQWEHALGAVGRAALAAAVLVALLACAALLGRVEIRNTLG